MSKKYHRWCRIALNHNISVYLLLWMFISVIPLPVIADNHALSLGPSQYTVWEENKLVSVMKQIQENRLDEALDDVRLLVEKSPTFNLAHLLYGDLLSTKVGVAAGPSAAFLTRYQSRVKDLRHEAQLRYQHHVDFLHKDKLPSSLLLLAKNQPSVVVVDLEESRLYLYGNQNGQLVLLKDYYVSTGKNGPMKVKEGDQKTPLGVYFVTSRIASNTLPDFYGYGALPINYPNEWDRRHKRTGNGIWLHGVPSKTYSRPPRASDGCIALTNIDLAELWDDVFIGRTPVIISNGVQWVDESERIKHWEEFNAHLDRWLSDWESLDIDRYARNYSRYFEVGARDYDVWIKHKKRVNSRKSHIKVKLSDLSVFSYPGESDLIITTFLQDYKSSNYSEQSKKRQYWRLEKDKVWRIVYEDDV